MTIRIQLVVFGRNEPEGRVPRWTEVWEKNDHAGHIEPCLLRAEDFDGVRLYLFALESVEDDIATMLPSATHANLPLLKDLPQFGFRKVSEGERGYAHVV